MTEQTTESDDDLPEVDLTPGADPSVTTSPRRCATWSTPSWASTWSTSAWSTASTSTTTRRRST